MGDAHQGEVGSPVPAFHAVAAVTVAVKGGDRKVGPGGEGKGQATEDERGDGGPGEQRDRVGHTLEGFSSKGEVRSECEGDETGAEHGSGRYLRPSPPLAIIVVTVALAV